MASKRRLAVVLFFFIYLMIAILIHSKLSFIMRETYKIYPYTFLIGLAYVPAGVLLGLTNVYENFRVKGKWKFKTSHFLFFSIPSLYLLFYIYLNYLPFGKLPSFLAVPLLNTKLYPLYGLIFGFGLITSFYKIGVDGEKTS